VDKEWEEKGQGVYMFLYSNPAELSKYSSASADLISSGNHPNCVQSGEMRKDMAFSMKSTDNLLLSRLNNGNHLFSMVSVTSAAPFGKIAH
jgi:hypothetical protein